MLTMPAPNNRSVSGAFAECLSMNANIKNASESKSIKNFGVRNDIRCVHPVGNGAGPGPKLDRSGLFEGLMRWRLSRWCSDVCPDSRTLTKRVTGIRYENFCA